MVRRIWKGCRPEYRSKLWERRLNPEVTTLQELTEELVILEKSAQIQEQSTRMGGWNTVRVRRQRGDEPRREHRSSGKDARRSTRDNERPNQTAAKVPSSSNLFNKPLPPHKDHTKRNVRDYKPSTRDNKKLPNAPSILNWLSLNLLISFRYSITFTSLALSIVITAGS